MSFDPNSPPEDPFGSTPPPPVPPPVEAPLTATEVTEGTGLPRNIAAALACIFLLIGGVAFYILDRRDRYVRFYALQSIVLSAVFCVIGVALNLSAFILGHIPLVGWIIGLFFLAVSWVAGLTFLVLWLMLIFSAYQGKMFEMPILWKAAKRHIPSALL